MARSTEGGDEVVGFACFGLEARVPGLDALPGVLDVGVGMRPDLTGRGKGRAFASAVLDHGWQVPGTVRLRAVVQDWNARGRALLERLGFHETGTHRVGESATSSASSPGDPPAGEPRTPWVNGSGASDVIV